jgi:phosphatidylserine/phosphatidylglycerophosphate/cardiolipin synthase-like enzyme
MIFNRLFYVFALFALFQNTLSAQSIAIARAQPVGSTVTVRGIVSNGAELGKIRYLQDGTAGIAAFPGTGSVSGFDTAVFPGDSIEVTGTLVSYHELLEISPINAFSIISSGNPMPKPKAISLSELSDAYESQLLEFECISFSSAGGTFNNGGSYSISNSEGASAKVYLRSGHPMLGSSIPVGPIRLTAILSAYDDFQLLPSSPANFTTETCLYFLQKPVQSDIATTGFKIDWETSLPTNCILHLGTDPNPNIPLPVPGNTSAHTYPLTNLLPGTIYWVQVEAEHNGSSIYSEPVPFVTRSSSSGEVRAFFNKGIDPAFLNGFAVAGETKEAVLFETIERIDSAKQTIDVAIYNNNRSDITNALKAAHARGVRVRYIASLATSNTALNPAPAFPVLYGNTVTIMHNKFMVVDADLPDYAWVMGGSLNWTNQNVNTDFNNTLFIQDQSLARAYELEFEEMWGSDLLLPDTSKSRFGSAKRDNTPHQFIVGGNLVESYFSPTDRTTHQIETALRSAQSEALFGAFSFTKNELGNALVDVHSSGVPMRGIIENINDNGAEFQHLLDNGVNVRHHNLSGDFHHKYGVVDAIDWTSDPTVITGSHNWSVAAETENDENTLILHDPILATLYKAEFEKRWGEFPSSVQTLGKSVMEVFPNPTTGWLELRGLPETSGTILVKNTLGQVLISENQEFKNQSRLNVSGMNPGQYFVTFISAHAVASVSFQKI